MNRRSFLRGVLALTVAPSLPLVGVALPRIVGDGVHDDTDGLQALFAGQPFVVDSEVVRAQAGLVSGGTFRLTRTLVIADSRVSMSECKLIAEHDDTVLYVMGKASSFYCIDFERRRTHL